MEKLTKQQLQQRLYYQNNKDRIKKQQAEYRVKKGIQKKTPKILQDSSPKKRDELPNTQTINFMELQKDNEKAFIRAVLIGGGMTLMTILIVAFGFNLKEAVDTTKVIVQESVEITDEVLEE